MEQSWHSEPHLIHRIGWLRATILGANDGIASTASLITGVASATASSHDILIAGVAGILAGAMSMAAGEYVSVSSQSDTERHDLEREKLELARNPEMELQELANIYVERGLDKELAMNVAIQLTAKDALAAHAREELGISEFTQARPLQAALASAAAFGSGAILPMIAALLSPIETAIPAVFISALLALGLLGAIGAKIGGASIWRGIIRVTIWGALAMTLTAFIGRLIGTQV